MQRLFELDPVNGAQVVDLNTKFVGLIRVVLLSPATITAGGLTVEHRLREFDGWIPAKTSSQDTAVFGSMKTFWIQGSTDFLRFTLSGVVGTGKILGAVYKEEQVGFLPRHFTDDGGFNSRLRVDIGNTAFWAGKEFRTFYEFSIQSGTATVIRVTAPVSVCFRNLTISVDAGGVRMVTAVGGTESGLFNTALPVLPKNTAGEIPQPPYISAVTIATGGAHTGGVEIDVVRVVAGGGQSSTVMVVGDGDDAERGVGPGVYYFKLSTIGNTTSTGVIHAFWEDRPPFPG